VASSVTLETTGGWIYVDGEHFNECGNVSSLGAKRAYNNLCYMCDAGIQPREEKEKCDVCGIVWAA
jgi:hypothetical protein